MRDCQGVLLEFARKTHLISGVRFQVSGFRCQETCSTEGTIHHLRHTLPFPQLTARGVLALGLPATMFSPKNPVKKT